mmetsp:Transcript_62838/g.192201  ORF Transcript_62838/g.192201 Transcript_62838/m.192201 type:complete len:209 (-) Transcript_62838:946-1572(-)
MPTLLAGLGLKRIPSGSTSKGSFPFKQFSIAAAATGMPTRRGMPANLGPKKSKRILALLVIRPMAASALVMYFLFVTTSCTADLMSPADERVLSILTPACTCEHIDSAHSYWSPKKGTHTIGMPLDMASVVLLPPQCDTNALTNPCWKMAACGKNLWTNQREGWAKAGNRAWWASGQAQITAQLPPSSAATIRSNKAVEGIANVPKAM